MQVVCYVLATADVDAVQMVPCFSHAFSKQLAAFSHRMEMCRQALADFDPARARVSDVEGVLSGTSRTIDTVRHLRGENPDTEYSLVVGTDIFPERHDWKEFEALERLCQFVVIGRRGYPTPKGHDIAPPLVDVSSTQIREGLASGVAPGKLVSRRVAQYIQAHGLYRS
ncbi:MAG: nicotinate-nucleotide adenylyltransferase [Myxococcota bacterium]